MTWPTVTLGEVCQFKYGKSLAKPNRTGGAVPVYGSNGIVGGHSDAVTAGPTIIIGRKGSFGEVHYSAGRCWPIDTTYYVDETTTRADLGWLKYRLRSLGLKSLNRAAAIPGLNREDAYRKELQLPPLAEQRRIAAILDKADAVRTKRRETSQITEQLLVAVFEEMFDDGASRSLDWPIIQFDELMVDSPQNGLYLPADRYGSGVRILRIDSFSPGRIKDQQHFKRLRASPSEIATYGLVKGDLIIGRVNSLKYLGRSVAISDLDESTVFESNMMRVRVDRSRVNSAYLNAYLNGASVQAHVSRRAKRSVNQASINQTDVRLMPIRLPPLELQQEYASRIAKVEQLASVHISHLAELDALFASLQQQAFAGELV